MPRGQAPPLDPRRLREERIVAGLTRAAGGAALAEHLTRGAGVTVSPASLAVVHGQATASENSTESQEHPGQ